MCKGSWPEPYIKKYRILTNGESRRYSLLQEEHTSWLTKCSALKANLLLGTYPKERPSKQCKQDIILLFTKGFFVCLFKALTKNLNQMTQVQYDQYSHDFRYGYCGYSSVHSVPAYYVQRPELHQQNCKSQLWWCKSVILALGRQKQE